MICNCPKTINLNMETTFHFLLSCVHYNDLRQRYFSDLGLPLTVETLLKGKPDESVAVNNLIFKKSAITHTGDETIYIGYYRVPSDGC